MAAYSTKDLDSADGPMKIRDKFGVEYLKLPDGGWMSNELQVLSSKEVAKKRPEAPR